MVNFLLSYVFVVITAEAYVYLYRYSNLLSWNNAFRICNNSGGELPYSGSRPKVNECLKQDGKAAAWIGFETYEGCYRLTDSLQHESITQSNNRKNCIQWCEETYWRRDIADIQRVFIGLHGQKCYCFRVRRGLQYVNKNHCYRKCQNLTHETCGGQNSISLYSHVRLVSDYIQQHNCTFISIFKSTYQMTLCNQKASVICQYDKKPELNDSFHQCFPYQRTSISKHAITITTPRQNITRNKMVPISFTSNQRITNRKVTTKAVTTTTKSINIVTTSSVVTPNQHTTVRRMATTALTTPSHRILTNAALTTHSHRTLTTIAVTTPNSAINDSTTIKSTSLDVHAASYTDTQSTERPRHTAPPSAEITIYSYTEFILVMVGAAAIAFIGFSVWICCKRSNCKHKRVNAANDTSEGDAIPAVSSPNVRQGDGQEEAMAAGQQCHIQELDTDSADDEAGTYIALTVSEYDVLWHRRQHTNELTDSRETDAYYSTHLTNPSRHQTNQQSHYGAVTSQQSSLHQGTDLYDHCVRDTSSVSRKTKYSSEHNNVYDHVDKGY